LLKQTRCSDDPTPIVICIGARSHLMTDEQGLTSRLAYSRALRSCGPGLRGAGPTNGRRAAGCWARLLMRIPLPALRSVVRPPCQGCPHHRLPAARMCLLASCSHAALARWTGTAFRQYCCCWLFALHTVVCYQAPCAVPALPVACEDDQVRKATPVL